MNAALSCINDTIRLLLDEAREARQLAREKRGTPEEAFVLGRSDALTQSLHTWSNQLETFEIEPDLDGIRGELKSFLAHEGY